ncbi:MAG TPA: phasin [Xanthobacteraceae bacterium]|nr:phasin [Xanthobacteraceae bacterium]
MTSNDRFEIPSDLRAMAENSFEQARKAFENFVNAAHQTAASFEGQGETVRTSAREISAKAIGFAENNMKATLDYTQKLLQAKDFAEIMRLNTEFAQTQMRALAEQGTEIGQVISRAAMNPTNKP